ncbi:3-phosphoshikimate 1-carboxyvinyltransferase [Geoglobus ahangari]|uniref:3-phosphoshikimate 1-carboxyvinyltransferase n=1 Tax=Geoglobus ahangari TaxID=113653 RepID=A0A0F7DBY0_9EURY|nr:3-phosphoshikimate 1-carboxyvinyltransferase [Geoglobus ahangari]AKG91876.1 3-phosphoshikimate 1-carboxyvinyltransferase [Geoglobus ahangari]
MDVRISKSEVKGELVAPPSKSYTHRAFFASALSKKSVVKNPLISDDTLSTLWSCIGMGARVSRKAGNLYFRGTEEIRPGYYYAGNSGTTLRILISLLSLSERASLVDGDESLRKRPNLELAEALMKLGAKISGGDRFTAPLSVRGPIRGGVVRIAASSSQFVTSLLFALPLLDEESTVIVEETKSRPYIDVTLDVLERSGMKVEADGKEYHIHPSEFDLREFQVPPDFSSLSYIVSAGVIAGEVKVNGVVDSRQGDKVFLDVVREMGGEVSWKGDVVVARKSELEGIEFDARDTPDLVPTIAVLAALAKGETRIRNAEHLRIKETDRIRTVVENLKRLGVDARETRDGMIIRGGRIEPGTIDSFGDHRIAMAFSLLGLVGEVVIRDAECVGISYPSFFRDLMRIEARVEVL